MEGESVENSKKANIIDWEMFLQIDCGMYHDYGMHSVIVTMPCYRHEGTVVSVAYSALFDIDCSANSWGGMTDQHFTVG